MDQDHVKNYDNMSEKLYEFYYVNLAGNSVINTVKKPEIVSSGSTKNLNIVQDNEKDYVNASNFSIEGKWKSIGDYGFGQAQKNVRILMKMVVKLKMKNSFRQVEIE